MNSQKREAPSEPGANQTMAAVGERNNTANVIHINHSYNVISNGQRIGSFLTQDKAIQFAKAVVI